MRTATPRRSLSYADGLAKAFAVRGDVRPVVAVIGDGALTGGMAWEALNNIAAAQDRPVVIVVNDNGRSYSPTIGGVADALASLRLRPGYEQALLAVRQSGDLAAPGGGHRALRRAARDQEGPQGRPVPAGHVRGPRHEVRRPGRRPRHRRRGVRAAPGPLVRRAGDRARGDHARASATPRRRGHHRRLARHRRLRPRLRVSPASAGRDWTTVFSDELVAVGAERSDVVAITAAMLHPTGLAAFAERLPRPRLRRRHRRAARDDLRRGPGDGRPAPGRGGLLHLPEPGLRPVADGRRAAPPAGHRRPGPRRGHRHRRCPRTTACGTPRSAPSSRGCGWRCRATRRP